jgi:hypothetical protein
MFDLVERMAVLPGNFDGKPLGSHCAAAPKQGKCHLSFRPGHSALDRLPDAKPCPGFSLI